MKRNAHAGFARMLIGIPALVTFIFACGSTQSEESHSQGYISRDNDRWATTTIAVCFEQDDANYTSSRGIIAEVLNTEYNKFGFQFTGFETCNANYPAIAVRFTNSSASGVDEIGSAAKIVRLGLNHECRINGAGTTPVPYLGSNCLRNVALHEFGHVLGLHHEMNRRDNDGVCTMDQRAGRGEDKALQIGDYDRSSVMNYCFLFEMNKYNKAVSLSAGDIRTINAIYHQPLAGVDNMPASAVANLSVIDFKVTGVSAYWIKYGRNTIDCKKMAGYKHYTDLDTQWTGAALASAFLAANAARTGDFRICLLGEEGSEKQNPLDYSSIDVNIAAAG